jgi:Rrf2 family iron-sulfur cluster assembly transcriptional regulator
MLSNASKYAIRSILYLTIHSNETKKISAKTIAEKLEISPSFLAKLLQQLTINKLVSSTKGPNGGFFINKANSNKSVWDIIKCIDGLDKFDQCFLGLSACSDTNPCPVHFMVSPFKQKIISDFKDKTIIQFTEEIKKNGSVISLKDLDITADDVIIGE